MTSKTATDKAEPTSNYENERGATRTCHPALIIKLLSSYFPVQLAKYTQKLIIGVLKLSNFNLAHTNNGERLQSRGRHLNQEARMGWRLFSRAEFDELKDPAKKITVIGSLVTSLSGMIASPVLASESVSVEDDAVTAETATQLPEATTHSQQSEPHEPGPEVSTEEEGDSPVNLITHEVVAGDHPYDLALSLGFDSVKEMADYNDLTIDWEYQSDSYRGPYLHIVPGQVLVGENQNPKPADGDKSEPDQKSEAKPDTEPSSTDSTSDPESKPDTTKKSEPETQLSPEYVAVLNHYDAMNRYCGQVIPTGKQKLSQSQEEVDRLAADYAQAKDNNSVGAFLLDLRHKQFKYLASQLDTDYEGAISHCISGIARETNIVWDNLDDERQQQWQILKKQLINEVAQGQSLQEIESRIEEAKALSIDAHDKLARAVPELKPGLSEELAVSRAIRLLAGDSLRQLVIDEVKWVVNDRDDGTTLNGLLGRVLVYDLHDLDEPIQTEISNEQLQAFGRRYVEGEFTLDTFDVSLTESRSEIKALYELLLLDPPSSSRVDELAIDVLVGRSLADIRKGLVGHKAGEKTTSPKEVYKEIIQSHITDETVLGDEELIDGLAANLEASDLQKADVTINAIIQAADSGDIEELEALAAPIIEAEGYLGMTGRQIKDLLLEKYGHGNSGKLSEKELEIIGESWGNHKLNPAAAEAFRLLSEAFALEFGHPIEMSDSYRSYAQQVETKKSKGRLAAEAGTSNHGWGLAIDLASNINDFGTKEHKWMRENAAKFGWVLPAWANDGKGIEEPWHWEYTGKPDVAVDEIEGPEKDEKPQDNKFELPDTVEESISIFGPTGKVLFSKDGKLLLQAQENMRRAADKAPTWEKAAKADWREQRDSSLTIPLHDVALLYGAAGFAAEEESVWVEQVAATIAISNAIKIEDTYWFTMQLALNDGDSPRACFSGVYLETVSDPEAKINPFECVKLAYESYQENGRSGVPELINGRADPFMDEAQEAVDKIKFDMAYNPDDSEQRTFEDRVTSAIEGKIHIAEEELLERSVIELHTKHGFSEQGAAWFTANLDWESGFKPHVCGDHGKSCGLAQWQQPRREQIAKQFGEFPQDIWGQFEAAIWEMKTHYPEAYRIYSDPDATEEELQSAAKIYEGYSEAGQRHHLGKQLAETIQSEQ